MSYALVHYPNIDTTPINQLRNKYDPQVGMIEAHITLLFPLDESIGEQSLISHIDGVLSGWRPFPIRLKGLLQSWDDYLFLSVDEGSEIMIRLHDELYAGMLAGYSRDDIPFTPHVTLGVFDSSDRCAQVMMEAETMTFDYSCVVDRFHLVKISSDRSLIAQTTELRLSV